MKAQIVSFHCVLKNVVGQVISQTFNRDVITQMPQGRSAPMPALALGLGELSAGERRHIPLPANEAYGLYDPRLALERSRHSLSPNASVGDTVELRDEAGHLRPYRIVGANKSRVFLDGNHPLAGQDLVFEIEVVEARDASPQEIAESAETSKAYLH